MDQIIKHYGNAILAIIVLLALGAILMAALAGNGYVAQAFQEKYDRTYAPIADDLRQSGFRPTDSLLKNIHRFECLSDRRCTLRELADLKKNPDFGRDSPKGQCFGRIVAELQEQERTRVQENDLHQQNTDLPEQVHSMKMEMMLAQMEM